MKDTGILLQTFQDKYLILPSESNIRGGLYSVMGDRFVKSEENKKKILYIDAIKLYGWAMSESLPYDETEMWYAHPDLYMNKLEEIFDVADESDIGYFLEVDLRCPDNIKKTKNFPFCPENQIMQNEKYKDYMKKMKPKNYTKAKKL